MSGTVGKTITHVAGTFLIQATASFLNGAGLGDGEDRNVTVPKTFRDGKGEVPYVSAQAWRRWLRNTFVDESGWPASESRAIAWNPKGNVNKIASELNPVEFPEDDVFGYMRAEAGQGRRTNAEESEELEEADEKEDKTAGRTKSVMRASPFMASVLVSLRSTGWKGRDQGFVHLEKYDPQALAEAEIERFLSAVSGAKKDPKLSAWERLGKESDNDFVSSAKAHAENGELEDLRRLLSAKAREEGKGEITFIENPCSPLPYTTCFYNTHLQGIFCLDYRRLGVFWNLGDRIELEEAKARRLLGEGKIVDVSSEEPYRSLSDEGRLGRVYRVTDKIELTPRERASALLRALSVLRGGAKQSQFGTDVSPKVLIMAGLTCGNPVFNHLFRDDQEAPVFKTETFKEIVTDYADRLTTPIFVGIRSGYLKNEAEVKALNGIKIGSGDGSDGIEVRVMTPLQAAQAIGEYLR